MDTFEELRLKMRSNLSCGQRKGQALVNALYEVDVDLYNDLNDLGLNCFYDDDLYPTALDYVYSSL